ncbi:CWF19-like protein 1, partial [Phenoliferia sp. Uapishka_3]
MTTTTPLKILVTGGASSSIPTFFTKLRTLQAKHNFSICLALDLFSDVPDDSLDLAQLIAGEIDVPVQVYVAVGGGKLPNKIVQKMKNGEEVCKNVTVLGMLFPINSYWQCELKSCAAAAKAGLITLATGLKIATFGGSFDAEVFDAKAAEGESLPDPLESSHFTQADVTSFLSLLTPAPSHSSLPSPPLPPPDILLTHAFPTSISLLSSKPLPSSVKEVASPLDQIAHKSHAKYHFVGGAGVFWEREPFSWPAGEGPGVCRAIALGELGNVAKERWFYAFSITPHAAATAAPPNATASPFTSGAGAPRGLKRPAGSLNSDVNEYGVPNFIFGGQNGGDRGGKRGKGAGPPPEHYTCNICNQKGHWIQDCPERAERDAARPPRGANRPLQPDECWFCLSNPKVTKHLIASIGSETYLTLPKGQILPTSKTGTSEVAPVPGGGHVLLIPIAHYPTLLSVPADQAVSIISEIEQYKSGLRACYASFGASLLSFEVGRLSGKGGHAHVQICPVPNALAGNAEATFRSEGEKQGITFEADGDAALKRSGVSDNYFRVDLPDGSTLVHIIKPGTPFSLQFGRATLATLLGIPDRTDWKVCVKSDADEKADTQKFKAAFKAFDPSE